MDIKEKMIEKYNSNQRFEHEINIIFKNRDLIYCFVEGDEDRVFYHNKLQYFNENSKLKFIVSKGKRNVIRYNEVITEKEKWKYFKSMFFVDRDYDNYKEIETIFITDAYSIENYFVSCNVLEKILEYDFGIADDRIIFDISKMFRNTQKDYHKFLLEINAFLKLQQIKEEEKKEEKRLNIDKLKLNEMLEINLDGIVIKKNLEECINMLSDYYDYSDLEFKEVLNSFDSNRYIYDFRGKYEIYFIEKYISKILEEINKKENIFGINKNIKRYQNDVIKRFLGYAECPENLRDYYDCMINRTKNL
ncbi:DUF4435 domain-containing protein [Mammaliicoccus sciuri]|uniref:DUF4435 domain-containing protein n=1 Tax=Mammaliicoccus sciuri TaxID=1296 RepID=UPI001C3E68D4|nr:DUF4435 domain-containing protein [Mammaliicoccus sciuri]MBV5104852.1 DUF4435 domain-containing protein [Mammaliicoccus sciuri]MEB5569199.1 DUF4435 domain-containing protein [Mammaliicoccus sciuri]MEB5790314.1 DUF4435 domain-containing protein [Mammaliicoccus sciuri]MEB7438051.1 DUF4435 domain-containing protein [Mammaliicoccus sciuri]MEB7966094.1 DUF4435 domain-containing protein [Mammaliicoccus sciuri]